MHECTNLIFGQVYDFCISQVRKHLEVNFSQFVSCKINRTDPKKKITVTVQVESNYGVQYSNIVHFKT